ncbi:hypothetical protein ACFLZN_01470 [Nanoarchaeota archaeon]
MRNGYVHLHKKKRDDRKTSRTKEVIDKVVMAVAFIAPFTALPQVYDVWFLRQTEGVSLITWALFFIFAIPLLMYGIIHKEKPLIVMYALWIVMDLGVMLGLLII